MLRRPFRRSICRLTVLCWWLSMPALANEEAAAMIRPDKKVDLVREMVSKFGEQHRQRIESGVERVAELWKAEDGSADDYAAFCRAHFIPDAPTRRKTFERLEKNFEALFGRLHQISRTFSEPLDLDLGPPLLLDHMFAKYSPAAHVSEDLFKHRIAFAVLLNFPSFNLSEKLRHGPAWSREQWAHARLADMFNTRVPGEVERKMKAAFVEADTYISEYNIMMDRLLAKGREASFPTGLKLISHWGLRDELKAQYARPDGLACQRLIHRVMERIVDQSIPRTAIQNTDSFWDPESNEVFRKQDGAFNPMPAAPEADVRYRHLLNIFHAQQLLDPHVPDAPTLIARRFEHDRQIPEQDVERLLTSVVSSPLAKEVARFIEKRLGRKLEPFDVWYDGFKARGQSNPQELDRIVSSKYPSIESFQRDLPTILRKLGFAPEKADFLAARIQVDPARGAGHAMGAAMREDKAHLRTRASGGLNYKGYNIAIHELGHTVEQVFSLNEMDYYMLNGVPNTAFTEAFAFVFQDRDLQLLGLQAGNDERRTAMKALDTFWGTYEIGGVALVDMKVWRWMYDHPRCTASELREAVLEIAREVWNEHYASVFDVHDTPLLAIYSHMIDGSMYLPDYPLGHIISFQVESYLRGKSLGREIERMCRLGRLTPAQWMEEAVGAPLSAEPLLQAARSALAKLAQ